MGRAHLREGLTRIRKADTVSATANHNNIDRASLRQIEESNNACDVQRSLLPALLFASQCEGSD